MGPGKANFEHMDATMVQFSCNIDDMNPEQFEYVLDRLFAAGVNDAWVIPIVMKRNRPAHMLQVLADGALVDTVKDIVFSETTTFGLRYHPVTVHRLERRFHKVDTPWGFMHLKAGYHEGRLVQISAEYRECRAIAEHPRRRRR